MNRPRMFLALTLAALCGMQVARATTFIYGSPLDGPSEPTASLATGSTTVTYDDVAHTLHVQFDFTGLEGTSSAAHIHAATLNPFSGTAGVATTTPFFAGFPTGVTSGVYDNLLDLTQASSWNAPYITANGGTTAGAETALIAAINAGKAYLNIHSSKFGGGEIRGFLRPVPEPATVALASMALMGLGGLRRRK